MTLCTFFYLLGTRSLNEPDEGRYSEIAREMIESGDWLVPHFWYLPHFDKPPMTYWLVAVSMKLFGQSEWAVRLPLALAGLSGVCVAWLFGRSVGGRRVGFWSALILQSSLLYFVMARMLTTDIFLTQFVAWAIYCFWRSWLSLRNTATGTSTKSFWLWHFAGWLAVMLGFLTKGPVALAIPLVAILYVVICRWKTFARKGVLFTGLFVGLLLSLGLASFWFLAADRRIPHTLNYMLFHQAAGHVLGGTIKGRKGFPGYFFAILAGGLLPWTLLLGWLWRRAHWRNMSGIQKDGWLMLNAWTIFTFALFNVTHSKLPPYILPMFPPLAAMLALRFFGETKDNELIGPPAWAWRWCAVSALLLPIAFALGIRPLFHVTPPHWFLWQAPIVGVVALGIFWLARNWSVSKRALMTAGAAITSLWIVTAEAPLFETELKFNQTLKPLGQSLQKNYQPGDAVICWGTLPEGLPFYSGGVISISNRPFFAGMNLSRVPFEFPGNQERLGPLLLSDENENAELTRLLTGDRRVLLISDQKSLDHLQKIAPDLPLHVLVHSGQWQLLSNH